MILRIWHGWTTPENADAYERLLRESVFPGIRARQISGLGPMRLLRRLRNGEVEFVTILEFDTVESVRAFAGEDHEAAYVPPKARALLERFDERAAHYELRHNLP